MVLACAIVTFSHDSRDFILVYEHIFSFIVAVTLLCNKETNLSFLFSLRYKNGKPLIMADLPWKYSFQQSYGLNFLEIRRLVTTLSLMHIEMIARTETCTLDIFANYKLTEVQNCTKA